MSVKPFFYFLAYEIDLFKRPFTLKILAKDKKTTFLGSFLSLVILIAISVSISQSDMVLHINPNIIEKTISQDVSPQLNFGSTGVFIIGVVDANRTGFIDETIFKVEVWSLYKVGGVNVIPKNKQFFPKRCETKDANEMISNQFKGFDYSRYLCLPKQEFVIQGDQDEGVYMALSFILRICNNITDGGICQSEENIKKALGDKFFYLNFPDISVDVDLYEHPFLFNQKSKILAVSTTESQYVHMSMQQVNFSSDFSPILHEPTTSSIPKYLSNQLMSMPILEGTFSKYNSPYFPLVHIYFTSTKEVVSISRRYMKLQEVLANAAGLTNTLLVIGFILTSFQAKLQLLSNIINNLYISHQIETKEKKDNKNGTIELKKNENSLVFIPQKETEQPLNDIESSKTKNKPTLEPENTIINSTDDINIQISAKQKSNFSKKSLFSQALEIHAGKEFPISNQNPQKNEKIKESEECELNSSQVITSQQKNREFKDNEGLNSSQLITSQQKNREFKENGEELRNFEHYLENDGQKNELNFHSLIYLKAKFNKFFRRKLPPNQKLLLKAEELYIKETDIVHIMLKLQEIDKLKYIMLNPEQLALFNLLEKPIIHLRDNPEEKNTLIRLSNLFMNIKKEKNNQEIMNYYKLLLKNEQKSEINKRILKLLEDQMEFEKNF